MYEFSVGSQFEAQIAHDYLADNGITCVIRCDEIPLKPGFSFGLEGWGSLMVPAGDAARARELLALIPGVGQPDEENADQEQSVSGAFQLQLNSVLGLAVICLLWPFMWQVAIWYLLPLTGWGAADNQHDRLLDIFITISNFGVLPLFGLFIILTNSHVLFGELKRAIPALLAAFALVLFSPIWLAPTFNCLV